MIEKNFHFLSGLPRSGSTVLASILNQNPEVYTTPTSPMLDQLIENQNIWHNLQTVKANPIPIQLDNITRRMINGMWQHIPQKNIIDKNRGWGKNMPASTILFGEEIKMVAMIRDIPSIMASWLRILHENPNSYLDRKLRNQGLEPNDENCMFEMWQNMVRDCVESLHQAKRDAGDRLLLVNYDDLIDNPRDALESIEKFLNLPRFEYDFENIINITVDDDLSAWGLQGMHTIRPLLRKTAKNPEEVLGSKLFNIFADIQDKILDGKF